MSEANSNSPSGPGSGSTGIVVLASAFLGILIGGAGTFAAVYGIGYRMPEPVAQPEAGAAGANPGGGPPMGLGGGRGGPPGGGMGMGGMGMGGMGGGMGMGGMGGPRGKRNLTQMVGKLELLTRGKMDVALTPEQTVKMSALLAEMNQAEKMTADEAQAHLDALEGLLTAEQKEILDSIGLPFGGRGGGPGGGRPGGGGMGPPGGGMGGPGGPGGMGGGGGPDDENPFKQEANQKRLQDFLSRIKPAASDPGAPANSP